MKHTIRIKRKTRSKTLKSVCGFASLSFHFLYPSSKSQLSYSYRQTGIVGAPISFQCNINFLKGNMAEGSAPAKNLVEIDIISDTVCPWCFVGKRNLDKALDASNGQYDFRIRWHPFQLNPNAPKEGLDKRKYYEQKFGSDRSSKMGNRMSEIFRSHGLEYNLSGLTGNTLDSHRLIYFAGQQDLGKQHDLVGELFLGYFTQAKYIGDREYLLECARKIGVEGAAEFLEDPNNGLNEVKEELNKYSGNINGVPHFVINNGKQALSGAQPPELFLKAFEAVTK